MGLDGLCLIIASWALRESLKEDLATSAAFLFGQLGVSIQNKRTRIDMINNPDISKRSGYFIDRSYYLEFQDPISHLEPLEKKVIQVLELKYPTIRLKVRFHDVVYAKKLFTFFALTYLNLTSFEVAHYLKLERSTLSYHLHHMMDLVDVYQKYQIIFKELDQWLYEKADSVGYRKYKSAYFSHKREKVKA